MTNGTLDVVYSMACDKIFELWKFWTLHDAINAISEAISSEYGQIVGFYERAPEEPGGTQGIMVAVIRG